MTRAGEVSVVCFACRWYGSVSDDGSAPQKVSRGCVFYAVGRFVWNASRATDDVEVGGTEGLASSLRELRGGRVMVCCFTSVWKF